MTSAGKPMTIIRTWRMAMAASTYPTTGMWKEYLACVG